MRRHVPRRQPNSHTPRPPFSDSLVAQRHGHEMKRAERSSLLRMMKTLLCKPVEANGLIGGRQAEFRQTRQE